MPASIRPFGSRIEPRAQRVDLQTTRGDQRVDLRIETAIPQPALAECELVLGIDEGGRCLAIVATMRRVRNARSLTMSLYSCSVIERPTSLASSSRITVRSARPLRRRIASSSRTYGRKMMKFEMLADHIASSSPSSGGRADSVGGASPWRAPINVRKSGREFCHALVIKMITMDRRD